MAGARRGSLDAWRPRGAEGGAVGGPRRRSVEISREPAPVQTSVLGRMREFKKAMLALRELTDHASADSKSAADAARPRLFLRLAPESMLASRNLGGHVF